MNESDLSQLCLETLEWELLPENDRKKFVSIPTLFITSNSELFDVVKSSSIHPLYLLFTGNTLRSPNPTDYSISPEDFSDPIEKEKLSKWLRAFSQKFDQPIHIVNAIDVKEFKIDEMTHYLEEYKLHLILSQMILSSGLRGKWSHWSHYNNPLRGVGRGMVLSLQYETEKFTFKIIEFDQWKQNVIEEAFDLSKGSPHSYLRYSSGKWLQIIRQEKAFHLESSRPIRKGGNYLITGGTGKIGRSLAHHLAKQYGANVVVIGRKDLSASDRKKLSDFGIKAYIKADLGNLDQLEKCWQSLISHFKTIHGILHLSGVIDDKLLKNKALEDFKKVLSPKVLGLYYLDRISSKHPLDFLVSFSSLSAIEGNIGQSDYAGANAFMDDFMELRQLCVKKQIRYGKSLSINWGLWETGGMQMEVEGTSILPMSENEAFESLILALEAPNHQVVISKKRYKAEKETREESPTTATIDEQSVAEWVHQKIYQFTKIPNLKGDTSLVQSGMDSIAIVNALKLFEKDLKEFQHDLVLNKTLIFDYPTPKQLVKYFLEHFANPLSKKFPATTSPPPQITRAPSSSPPQPSTSEGIAIVGISGQFPQAENLEIFWDHISKGKNCVSIIPEDRWDWKTDYSPDFFKEGKSYGRHGGFLPDIKHFDPLFFGISPKDAKRIDPQERLFLQTVYHSIENAALEKLPRKTGVFAAAMFGHYKNYQLEDEVIDTSFASIANRISYFFDFQGPSISIDTMCSGSLTALHIAVQSLKRNECQLAIVGGVNLMPHPVKYRLLCQGKFLSKTGKCHPFSRDADGYVPGEGVVSLILKKESAALADKDYIHGIIRGSAINSGGKTSGFTIPSQSAQKKVIQAALQDASIKPSSISYIEAHGTGTELGDPIEIGALREAYQNEKDWKCKIGSVKSNIGHLESAAGLAGIVKTLLQMRYHEIVPTINCSQLNPYLNIQESPFSIAQASEKWNPVNQLPLRAGVSSFGAGGSNVHIILEEGVNPVVEKTPQLKTYIIPLSSDTKEGLERQKTQLLKWLGSHEVDLYSLGYTLSRCRTHLSTRKAFLVHNSRQLEECLKGMSIQINHPQLEDYATIFEEGDVLPFENIYPVRKVCQAPLYQFDRVKCWDDQLIPTSSKITLPQKEKSHSQHFTLSTKWRTENLVESKNQANELILIDLKNSSIDFSSIPHKASSIDEIERLIKMIEIINGEKKKAILSLFLPQNDNEELWKHFRKKVFDLGKRLSHISFPVKWMIVHSFKKTPIPEAQALSGFLKILPLENPRLTTALVGIDSNFVDQSEKILKRELVSDQKDYIEVQIKGEERQLKSYHLNQNHPPSYDISSSSIKRGGIYLIPGGLGHIGRAISFHLLNRYGAKLYLVGKSELTGEKKRLFETLKGNNGSVEYCRADLTKHQETKDLITKIKRENKKLNGIIFSSGKIDDKLLKEKSLEDFESVFDTKYLGVKHLDNAWGNDPLDFFVVFSSIASIFGNVGQSDYAMANAFLDQFATWRNQLKQKKERQGHTLSINWPLWSEGSSDIDPLQKKFLFDQFGLDSITDEDGILLFEHGLWAATVDLSDQFIPLKGDLNKLSNFISKEPEEKAEQQTPSYSLNGDDYETFISNLTVDILGISKEKIDVEKIIGDLGFNSIHLQNLAQKLNNRYGTSLAPSIFFTHNTIKKISAHLSSKLSPATKKIEHRRPPSQNKDAYAIIGMSGIMPGAHTLEEFWNNQLDGKEVIIEMHDRWPDRTYLGALIHGMDTFDPKFFGMSAREAMLMDPQHRLFLEIGFNTFIDAGYNPELLENIGVFVGLQFNDYQILLQQWKQSRHPYAATGNAHALLANRLSYYFNFHGPSQTIDTACSSALIALKRGIASLEQNECEMILVGATSLLIDPEVTDAAKSMGVLSPNSRCATFDTKADGYVRGEGVGCILIKPLQKAIEEGDHCYGIIRSCAENHGGKAHSLTAPNPEAQKALLLKAYEHYPASKVSYFEAHGTGTKLGDPIEIDALNAAWNAMGIDHSKGKIPIGSVKTHVGHLEPAAGMASILKVLLSLKHQILPHNRHLLEINPYIKFDEGPFYPLQENSSWEPIGDKRVAGISSFGFGGSNAHIVIEESERYFKRIPSTDHKKYLIPFSAKSCWSYQKWAKDLYEVIQNEDDPYFSLENLSYTLSVGRPHFDLRGGCIVSSKEELLKFLKRESESEPLRTSLKKIKSSSSSDLEIILKSYLSGEEVDWTTLYPNKAQRLSLPPYPFENLQSYWFEGAADRELTPV